MGAHVAVLGKFSGVPADHVCDLSFAVCGAYRLPWHISKLLGLWIAALCLGYETFKLYAVQEIHHLPVALL